MWPESPWMGEPNIIEYKTADRTLIAGSLQLLCLRRKMPRMKYCRLTQALIVVCCCPSGVLLADEVGADKWGFSLGAFLTDQDMKTDFQVGGATAGRGIDFEEDLGLDESLSVFRLDAFYRIADRHRLDFSIFDLSRSANITLSREIEWQDTIYPLSATLITKLDLSIYKAAYTYEWSRQARGYFGVTGGFYVADIGLSLGLPVTGDREVGSITAPLPVIGIRGEYFLSKRWRAHASAEWFFVDIDDLHGSLNDVLLGVDYSVFENAAIGLGFNSVHLDLDAAEKALRADLKWDYSGAIAYVQFRF